MVLAPEAVASASPPANNSSTVAATHSFFLRLSLNFEIIPMLSVWNIKYDVDVSIILAIKLTQFVRLI
jgi:hypothetical protein